MIFCWIQQIDIMYETLFSILIHDIWEYGQLSKQDEVET
jgi:hypothetical protein